MGEEKEVLWTSRRQLGWIYMLWARGIVDNCGRALTPRGVPKRPHRVTGGDVQ
jgi:hypothetical protein